MRNPQNLARAQCVLEMLPAQWESWDGGLREIRGHILLGSEGSAAPSMLRDLPGPRRCSHLGDDPWLRSFSLVLSASISQALARQGKMN